ncbi:hypothetical protein ACP70R_001155 [Stipagrostis hirtigluma subsp. patula]
MATTAIGAALLLAPRLPSIQAATAADTTASDASSTGSRSALFLRLAAAIDPGRHRYAHRCQGRLRHRFLLRHRSTLLTGTRSRNS